MLPTYVVPSAASCGLPSHQRTSWPGAGGSVGTARHGSVGGRAVPDAAQDLVAGAEGHHRPGPEHGRGVDEAARAEAPAQAPGGGERDEGPVGRADVDVAGGVEHGGREDAAGGVEGPRAGAAIESGRASAAPVLRTSWRIEGHSGGRVGTGRAGGGARGGGGQDDEGGEGRAAAGHRRAAYPSPSGA